MYDPAAIVSNDLEAIANASSTLLHPDRDRHYHPGNSRNAAMVRDFL